MRYTRPFTLVQRRNALAVYRSMLVAYDGMRFDRPPISSDQRQLVRQYRQAMRDFTVVLRNPDAKVDVERLNEAEWRSVHIAVDYTILRLGHGDKSDE